MTVAAPHHIAVAVLVEGGRTLLGHRTPLREYFPDCWDLVGGHVEEGESPEEALVRECREELGIEVLTFEPVGLRLTAPGAVPHHYLVTKWKGEPTNTAPDEHDDLRWFTAAELPGLVLADPLYLPQLTTLLEERPA